MLFISYRARVWEGEDGDAPYDYIMRSCNLCCFCSKIILYTFACMNVQYLVLRGYYTLFVRFNKIIFTCSCNVVK